MIQLVQDDDKALMQAFISREIENMLTAFCKCLPEMSEYLMMSSAIAPSLSDRQILH